MGTYADARSRKGIRVVDDQAADVSKRIVPGRPDRHRGADRVPIVRAPPAYSDGNFGSYPDYRHSRKRPPLDREREPVSDRAAALERQMLPRQINDTRRSATHRT
jgi:hypothetical protein